MNVARILLVAGLADWPENLPIDHLREADDRVERRAQLVTHRGEELGFRPAGHFGYLFGLTQLLLRFAPLQLEADACGDQSGDVAPLRTVPIGLLGDGEDGAN